MTRRHPLIEEAKADLDVAYEEVKRAEMRIMELEFEFNARLKEEAGRGAEPYALASLIRDKEVAQEGLDIENLYAVQNAAIQRFALISAAFAIVGSVNDEAMTTDLILRVLFRDADARENRRAIERQIRSFQRSLRAYARREDMDENDRCIREAWGALEAMLRAVGRRI